MNKIIFKLFRSFPGATINKSGEFIAHIEKNEWFVLENCKTAEEVKYKVLAFLSRGACKIEPYHSRKRNNEFHQFMLNGINSFLETNFTEDDMRLIYTELGNGVNVKLGIDFMRSGYDLSLLS